MDALTFNSEIIKSLAWPAAVVALVLMLKKPIAQLIPLLRKLKYKELEMEFSEEIAELKAEAAMPIPSIGKPTITQTAPLTDSYNS